MGETLEVCVSDTAFNTRKDKRQGKDRMSVRTETSGKRSRSKSYLNGDGRVKMGWVLVLIWGVRT